MKINTEILSEWNPWWVQEVKLNLLDRNLTKTISKWIGRKEIIGIIGVRRSGKTSLMNIIIDSLLKKIERKNILFIKCDDERIDKSNIISDAIELYKEHLNPKDKIFIFIDEIQEAIEWENTLKRIYDLEKNIKFFVSGSNFSILKEDLSYKLAGRLAYFELYPFSFSELIKTKFKMDKLILSSKKHEIKHYIIK